MMREPVEQRAGQPLGTEHRRPLVERQVAGDDRRATFVALAEDLEQQLGPRRRQRHIAKFVDDQQLVAGELTLKAQQSFFVPRLDQFVDEGRRLSFQSLNRRWGPLQPAKEIQSRSRPTAYRKEPVQETPGIKALYAAYQKQRPQTGQTPGS